MWTPVSREVGKEVVLRAILGEHVRDRDDRWRTILLLFFWPGLRSLQRKKAQWDSESERFWQNIVLAFLDVVFSLDLRATRMHPVSAIHWGTYHALYRLCESQWKRDKVEICTDAEFIQVHFISDRARTVTDNQAGSEEELRRHLGSGRISEVEFRLLLGTYVYGYDLRECAEGVGLTYEAAKKRRQRVLARLRDTQL
jgi:hypothetical protein